MAIQRQPYIELEECINDYMSESEQSIHKFHKLWYLAFRAMTELGLDFFYQIQSVKLPILANKTVRLPENYLNYSKVGILNGTGETIPFYYNNKLTTYADLLPERISKTQDNSVFNWGQCNGNTFYNYWDGGSFINLYGLPSGAPFVGSFKIDVQQGVILLGENLQYDYIILEYLASPAEGSVYYIPIQFKEAVISYLSWKDIKSMPLSRKGNLGEKRDRKHDYYNERRLAIARYKPITQAEKYQANLESQRLTVKA